MNNEVTVINTNPKTFTDAFGGMTFTFPPNEKVPIPLAAAIHIFGFNKTDKTQNKIRLGIANHPGGDEFLNNFKMEYVEYVRKDDAAEAEKLKIDLEAKQAELDEANATIEKLNTEIEQLTEALKTASKKTAKEK